MNNKVFLVCVMLLLVPNRSHGEGWTDYISPIVIGTFILGTTVATFNYFTTASNSAISPVLDDLRKHYLYLTDADMFSELTAWTGNIEATGDKSSSEWYFRWYNGKINNLRETYLALKVYQEKDLKKRLKESPPIIMG
jgi:hypothetical protein